MVLVPSFDGVTDRVLIATTVSEVTAALALPRRRSEHPPMCVSPFAQTCSVSSHQTSNSSSKDEGKITLFDDGTWSYGIHD